MKTKVVSMAENGFSGMFSNNLVKDHKYLYDAKNLKDVTY